MGERAAKIFGYILCAVLLIGSSQAYSAQPICKQVEAYGNDKKHELIIIPINRILKPKESGSEKGVSNIVGEALVDINNDGVEEKVLIRDTGIGCYEVNEEIVVLHRDTNREIALISLDLTAVEPEDESSAEDCECTRPSSYEIVKFKREFFVVGHTSKLLYSVVHLNKKNEINVLCEYAQENYPRLELKKSENAAVCKMALENKIQYVAFAKPHSLVLDKSTDSGVLYDGIALIDIDNDGRKKPVISMWEHAGKGCMIDYLQVLTKDRKAIDKTYSDKLPEGLCRTTTKAFVFNEATYLARLNEYGNNQFVETVFQLNKDKLQTICEIEGKPINYIK